MSQNGLRTNFTYDITQLSLMTSLTKNPQPPTKKISFIAD